MATSGNTALLIANPREFTVIEYSAQENYEELVSLLQRIMDKSQIEQTEEVRLLVWTFHATLRDALDLPDLDLPEGAILV